MSTQAFVQTDHHVIDVSKITYINMRKTTIEIHFAGSDKTLTIANGRAEQLMNGIAELDKQRKLTAIRAR